MTYAITHQTTYAYESPVSVSQHVARLSPRATHVQHCAKFDLEIHPLPALRHTRTDYFGNKLCLFSIQEVHQQLQITSKSQVTVSKPAPIVLTDTSAWEQVTALFRDPVAPDVVEPYQFVFDSPLVRVSFDLADYARSSFTPNTPLLVGVRDLTQRIFNDFKYDPKATSVATPLEEAWEKRHGVCQDFAHFGIACLRSLGLPARYVSGYLRTHPPAGQPRLVGADASHAWFSAFSPNVGWVDFDPTNNLQPGEEHIVVAYGRDFGDVSPVAGILTGGGAHEVQVSVDVAEL